MTKVPHRLGDLSFLLTFAWYALRLKIEGQSFLQRRSNLRRRRPRSGECCSKCGLPLLPSPWTINTETESTHSETWIALWLHFDILEYVISLEILFYCILQMNWLCVRLWGSTSSSTGSVRRTALGTVLCITGDHCQLWRGQVTSLRWVSGSEHQGKLKWESLNGLILEHMCAAHKGFHYLLCANRSKIHICLHCVCDTH